MSGHGACGVSAADTSTSQRQDQILLRCSELHLFPDNPPLPTPRLQENNPAPHCTMSDCDVLCHTLCDFAMNAGLSVHCGSYMQRGKQPGLLGSRLPMAQILTPRLVVLWAWGYVTNPSYHPLPSLPPLPLPHPRGTHPQLLHSCLERCRVSMPTFVAFDTTVCIAVVLPEFWSVKSKLQRPAASKVTLQSYLTRYHYSLSLLINH